MTGSKGRKPQPDIVSQALQKLELMYDVAEDRAIAERAAVRNALAACPAALELFDLAYELGLDNSPLPFYQALASFAHEVRMEVWNNWSEAVPVNQFEPQFFSAIIAAALEEEFFAFIVDHEATKQKG